MREIKADGKEYIPVPTGRQNALDRLEHLGKRESDTERTLNKVRWERAMVVAYLVGPPLGQGQKQIRTSPYMTMAALMKERKYSLLDNRSIRACLKAWFEIAEMPEITGNINQNVSLPVIDYPTWRAGQNEIDTGLIKDEDLDDEDDETADDWDESDEDGEPEDEQGNEEEDDLPEDKLPPAKKMPAWKPKKAAGEAETRSPFQVLILKFRNGLTSILEKADEEPELTDSDYKMVAGAIESLQAILDSRPGPKKAGRTIRSRNVRGRNLTSVK